MARAQTLVEESRGPISWAATVATHPFLAQARRFLKVIPKQIEELALAKPRSLFFGLFRYTMLLLLMVLVGGCGSRKTIINGLDERDANEIIVFLASKNIDAYKTRVKSEGAGGGGAVLWDISVDSDKATEAMAVLSANGLPRKNRQKLLDIFTTGGLVPSEMQEKIRYEAGLAEQIAGTIRKIDGILDADVQLSFPEEDPLNPKTVKGAVTASVFVKHNGVLDDPNSHLITKIRRLVASSVQGLNFENVTVIADRARFSEGTQVQQVSSGSVELVKDWGIVIAKDSIGHFQIIFFSIIAVLSIFVLLTMWLLWKIIPVARACGGIGFIFSFHSLELPSPEEEETEVQKTQASLEKPEDKGPKVQENIEST
jgi:type III secretion protein J